MSIAAGTGSTGTPAQYPEQSRLSGSQAGPHFVERRTGLRGQGIAPARMSGRTIRKNTEDELHEKVPEIPYVKAEHALRDLVCSIMERQDRMNEEILQRVIDLQYRMDDLEGELPARKVRKPAGNPGGSP